MAAVAAIVGARRNAGGRGSRYGPDQSPGDYFGRRPFSFDGSSSHPTLATGVATCACSILVCVGTVSVAQSWVNERQEKVEDYVQRVEEWLDDARDDLASSTLRVTAKWNHSAYPNNRTPSSPSSSLSPFSSLTQEMEISESAERSFRDAEQEAGLVTYMPLRFNTSFVFPSYYPTNPNGTWELLPSRPSAPTVSFEFLMRTRNSSYSSFSTAPYTMFWDELQPPRTPQPETKCRGTWIWPSRQCHAVKRLRAVCVQVYRDEVGFWQLHSKALSTSPPPPAADDWAPPTSTGAPSSVVRETFGCDPGPSKMWHPATFTIDRCWGKINATRGECKATVPAPFSVEIVVRSAQDPFIRANELTHTTLDFGPSPETQRAYGFTMLIVGLFLGMVPVLRCRDWARNKKKFDDFEARSSRYAMGARDSQWDCADDEDCGRASAGIYGSRHS